MKICIITGSYPNIKDGVGDYVKQLADHLKISGLEISIITSEHKDIADTVQSNYPIFPLVRHWNLKSIIKIIKKIKALQPNVIHVQSPSVMYGMKVAVNLLPLVIRLFLRNTITIATIHGFGVYSVLGKLRLSISIFSANGIIAVSEHIRKAIVDFIPFCKTPLKVIPIGANIAVPEMYAAVSIDKITLRKELQLDFQGIILVYFGFVNAGKGLETLLSSAKELVERGIRFKLILITELNHDNPYHKSISGLIQQKNLTDHVMISGYCPADVVSKYLLASDIGVFPFTYGVSTKRGSFLAAIAHGLPVITTKDDTIPSNFMDRQNMILITPNSTAELTAAILELMGSESLREKIGRNARQLAKEFSWHYIAAQHREFYRSFVSFKKLDF